MQNKCRFIVKYVTKLLEKPENFMRKKLYKTKAANKANLGKINSKCPLLLNFPACSSLALTYRISVFVTPTQYI